MVGRVPSLHRVAGSTGSADADEAGQAADQGCRRGAAGTEQADVDRLISALHQLAAAGPAPPHGEGATPAAGAALRRSGAAGAE